MTSLEWLGKFNTDEERLKSTAMTPLKFVSFLKGSISKKLILLFLSMLFSVVATSQRDSYHFTGKVLNKLTKRPIPNVHFSAQDGKVGTFSDKNGIFTFYLDTVPSVLVISHVGYETKRIIVDGRNESMTLYINPITNQLKEVVISASAREVIFKNEHYAILDYVIDSGLVYLLVYRNRFSRSELICRTLDGDTIAKSGWLDFTPSSLVRDCLGFLHILTFDSAYQVSREGKEIFLYHPVTLKKFNDVLSDCIASTPQSLYFKRPTDMGLGAEFYMIDRKNYELKWITRVRDMKKTNMLWKNPGDAMMLMSDSQPDQDGLKMAESIGTVNQARADFEKWDWVRRVVYRPMKSFLYLIGESICIFNIPDKQMVFYDLQGNFSYIIALELEREMEGKWTHDILIDGLTHKVFTTFFKSGFSQLYEINLNTGSLLKRATSYYPYPQKLSLYGNYLYYLYDDPIRPDNKMLFRQRF